ncbi:MAG: NPCBM/NEW2 domain-containing protein [Clostridiales bacterium]|nr:NPCBM/NEW2 domain-containing protein [Clostridiales bacterium]
MVKKTTKQALSILASLFLCAIMLFGGVGVNNIKAFAEEVSNNSDVLYLSDLPYATGKGSDGKEITRVGSGKLTMNQSDSGKAIQVKIEGAWYTFPKGIYAHAPSCVAYNISAYNQDHKYFMAYGGLLSSASKSDGALFYVQTSTDGKTWTYLEDNKYLEDGAGLVEYNQNAKHFVVDIKGLSWIRLVANQNKSNATDHVVWADAKLTTTLDEGEAGKSLTAYDAEIKAKVDKVNLDAIKNDKNVDLFQDEDLELLVLQREFVSRVGQYALKKFRSESADNKAMLDGWLLKDLDSLREFMLGGAPHKGNYYNSLTVLSDLYKYNKKDLDDKTLLKNKFMPDRTFGELCRTMMFSVALTHDGAIGSYLQGSTATNKSIPLRRYAIFKYMYQTERFVATRNADGSWKSETMNLFGSLRVEEMRFIMSNIIDDESILWLNDYVQTRINKAPNNVANLYTPHSYVRYTDPNYNNPVFYADANYDYFNQLFAVDYRGDNGVANNANKFEEGTVGEGKVGLWDTSYTVPAGEGKDPYIMTVSRSGEGETKIQKVWMNFNNKFKTGSVCGGISKSGTNIRTSRGIPAHVIGQPGHAAILYYGQDANGNGSWKIDNDVGGWLAATKGERHLLGWGNATWQRNSGGTVVYFHLAQACLNDYDNLVRAEEYTWLAKVYQGDLDKQEKLYEKALTTQILNLDAWYGLVQTYKANKTKTAADFSTLAGRIADTLWNHPVAMHCLFRLLTDDANIVGIAALQDPVFTTQIKSIEINALAKAKASGSTAAKSKVNYLLGIDQTSDIADFSFDGENAGCIVWVEDYADGTFTWKYSLDGKKTWKEVTFNEGDSHAYQLSEKELATISAENGIYVYIVGASPDNAYKINVGAKPAMPDTLYANDLENRVIGVDGTYEWRYCTSTETKTETGTEVTYTPTNGWISFAQASPDCTGDKIVEVRLKGTAKKPASESKIFTFTADTDTPERKYISVNYLSMVEFSTESQDAKRPNYAVNAIDGNAKTYWHTDYAINIKKTVTDADGNSKTYEPAYLTIKIDVPRYISGLEFAQLQYNSSFSIFAKAVKVYVSVDGENWGDPVAIREDLEELDDLKVVPFAEPVYGQYVKLVMSALYETNTNDGVFTTVSLVNLYEDTTKTLSPTGETMPSLSKVEPSGNKFAGLGDIISEEEAFVVGGEPTSDDPFIMDNPFSGGTEPSPKSYAGLWITLSVIGVVLVAAAVVVFVLYKRGIIKFKGKNSKPETATAETKVSAAKPKANTAATKVNDTKPKASTAETKVSAAKPKASTAETKVSAAKPKASTAATKVSAAKPKTSTAETKVSAAKPKASTTATKVNDTKPKK